MPRSKPFQFSLLSMLGGMLVVAFLAGFLRVSTEWQFILFGMVIMPGLAIGFALFYARATNAAKARGPDPIFELPQVLASVPSSVKRRRFWASFRSASQFIVMGAVLTGAVTWWSLRQLSATALASFWVAIVLALVHVAAYSAYRTRLRLPRGALAFEWDSAIHNQHIKKRVAIVLGNSPMVAFLIIHFYLNGHQLALIGAYAMAVSMILVWFADGPAAVLTEGVQVCGYFVPWEKLSGYYWCGDFVVLVAPAAHDYPTPMWLHVPTSNRDGLDDVLRRQLGEAVTPEDAWLNN